MPSFFLATMAALLLALAFILIPLFRNKRYGLALGLALAMPIATALLYLGIGTPEGIDPDTGQTGEIRTAVTELASQALRNPDRPEHWTRLGLAYKSLDEFNSAEHAFRRALFITPDDDFVRTELAETLLFASGRPELPDEARELLLAAAQSGEHQKALLLLGLDAFQRDDHAIAANHFERILEQLPPDSSVHDTVGGYLAMARERAGRTDPVSAAADAVTHSGNHAGSEPVLEVNLSIDAGLSATLSGTETVFVIVQPEGQNMPLAVRRLNSAALPVELRIDSNDAMMAGAGLDSVDAVVVTARVSHSGTTAARSGDFQGQSRVLSVQRMMETRVHIDQVL